MRRIVAIDPGGTTGWATYTDGIVRWGQVTGGIDGSDHLAELVTPFSTLIIEKYTIGQRTVKYSRQSDALELTGALKHVARAQGAGVVMQQPGEAMGLITDERLRQLNWWARGEQHSRDALRHLGYYLAKRRLIRLTGGGDGGS